MKDSNPFFVSRQSKKGILIFVLLALVVLFIPRIILVFKAEENFNVSSTQIQQLKERSEKAELKRFEKKSFKKQNRFHIPTQKFDPNTYTEKEWMALGLSEKQVAVVLKFTERGIYNNEQLQKIFVIPEELYELIKDSTYYPKKVQQEGFKEKKHETKKSISVELNSTDQETLESVPGIGPFFAKNILKYRDRLGGFRNKEQLLEVWKMDIDKYNTIENYLTIDKSRLKQLNLNSATVEELKNHPYFNWNIANSIIKIRNQKVKFKSVNEIKESVLIDEELFEKVKPYLTL